MKSSALIAAALSGAALIGYVSYRTLLQAPDAELPPATAPSESAARPGPVDTLPEFTLSNTAGEPQSIFSWPDNALVINFWATWCAPCLREIPLLKAYQETHAADGVQVVGIAVDRLEPVKAFVADMEFNYPTLVGESDGIEAAASFGIDFFALPFTVFTDAERNVLGVHTGELESGDLENLAAVLAELRAGQIDVAAARARMAGRR